ncbi:hypothetical protein ACFFGH_26250 [Lysobacter korlensis]|uniref:Uncharacterized protein n=1 Tax=Lysobacter korlensis TaxID=553636 RepID=A0ABV6RWJ0_9GAMM
MTENQNDQSSGGAGEEGTIPESETGLAVNVADGSGTTFEPEEDPSGAATPGEDADGKPRPDSHNAETNEDTVSGGPA